MSIINCQKLLILLYQKLTITDQAAAVMVFAMLRLSLCHPNAVR